jgi:hypothetical protein
MQLHPENGPELNGLIGMVENTAMGMAFCHGCGCDRPVNAVYLPYLVDGIKSCRFCRLEEPIE